MALNLNNVKTPGVYIDEVSLLPPSIAAVDTAIPAFIGYTDKAIKEGEDVTLKPTRITSLLEYRNYFGTAPSEAGLTVKVDDTLDGNGNLTDRQVNANITNPSPHNMYYSMQAFFANGGGPCYIVSVGSIAAAQGVVLAGDLTNGINAVEEIDEVTLFVLPEVQQLDEASFGSVISAALEQCGKLQDRFAVFDIKMPANPDTPGAILQAAIDFRNNVNLPLDNLKYGAAYTPNVLTTFSYIYSDDLVNVERYEVGNPDPVETYTLAQKKPGQAEEDAVIYNLSRAALDRLALELPVAPLAVGIYAKVDNTRGVFKAPANVALLNVERPTIRIKNADQNDLNVHTSGKSINAIRTFTGKGTLIWGARTLEGNSNEWRYISVRRFFNFAEESIKKGTEAFVFEPNDANTWTRVRAMIENFLLLQWRGGALAGAKPEDAFFVRVGLGQTMTALDILEGRMHVQIGMAVVRPAEFIILEFSHKMQVS